MMLGNLLSAIFSMYASKAPPSIAPVPYERRFHVGDRIVVCEFFWTDEALCMGFDTDARHGHQEPHEFCFGGSVSPGDVLEVLSIEDDHLIVKVHKEKMPYGAPCPHGMIFAVEKAMTLGWPEGITAEEARWQEQQREEEWR